MTTPTKVLNVARSQLGYRERPGKRTKFGSWYGLDGANWCDMFVSWVADRAGATDEIGRAAYTPAHAQWFKRRDRWGHRPLRGAIVFYDFPDSIRRIQHVGIVESVLPDRRIIAIEGNTVSGHSGSQHAGGGVYRRVRSPRHVVGYGYPAYGRERNVQRIPAQRRRHPPLTVDGDWGPRTTMAMQRWLRVDADGQIGPKTRIALQHALKVPADGDWGPVTRKALQRAVGVRPDGEWGPVTIKALQRRLNREWRR